MQPFRPDVEVCAGGHRVCGDLRRLGCVCWSPAWADAGWPCLPGAGPAWANRLARFSLAPGACPVGQRSGVQVGSLWSPTFPLDRSLSHGWSDPDSNWWLLMSHFYSTSYWNSTYSHLQICWDRGHGSLSCSSEQLTNSIFRDISSTLLPSGRL